MLKHPKPCVMEFKRRASKLRSTRKELRPALVRDVVQLLSIRGATLKSSNGDFCGLDDTMEMLSRHEADSTVHEALFEDIDDVFAVYVIRDAEIEFQCIRMHRQATSHEGMMTLLGQKIAVVDRVGSATALHIGPSDLTIDTSRLQISNPATRISELVGRTITNVRMYPFGVSLSLDGDLILSFEEGDLRCGDRAWRVPDPSMYGERTGGF